MKTYTIRGADGRSYQAGEPTAIEWAKQGRIDRATRVNDGSGWRAAEKVPVLAAAFPPPLVEPTVAKRRSRRGFLWSAALLVVALACLFFSAVLREMSTATVAAVLGLWLLGWGLLLAAVVIGAVAFARRLFAR